VNLPFREERLAAADVLRERAVATTWAGKANRGPAALFG
jgi:hypothetical protein